MKINSLDLGDYAFISSRSIAKATDNENNHEIFVVNLYDDMYTFKNKILGQGKPVPVKRVLGALRVRTHDIGRPDRMAFVGKYNPEFHIELELVD